MNTQYIQGLQLTHKVLVQTRAVYSGHMYTAITPTPANAQTEIQVDRRRGELHTLLDIQMLMRDSAEEIYSTC